MRRRFHSLRFSLLLIVLLCWLLPTLTLGVYMGGRVFATLREQTESAMSAGAEYAQSMTTRNISVLFDLARSVVYDREVEAAADSYRSGESDYETCYKLTRDYLDRKFSREESVSFALVSWADAPEKVVYTTQGYGEALAFLQEGQEAALSLSRELDTRSGALSAGGKLYLVRNLLNARMERYGVLVLGVRADGLFQPLLDNASRWGASCAVSLGGYGRGTFRGEEGQTGLRELGDTLLYTGETQVDDSLLRFQVQADRHTVYRAMDAFRTLMTWLLVLLVPVCLAIMLFVKSRIVRPIALLSEASDRIRGGELGVVVPMRGDDELGHLGIAFSEMSLRLKEMIDKSYKEEIALRDARIQAMQSRINPHFLNNALEAVNWQARLDGNDKVGRMVETLSVLLNASLDRNDRHLVALAEELEIADAYFYFVGLQFGQRLTAQRHVADGLERAQVPRLIIQTLLENAVEHGVAPVGGGHIDLNVYEAQGRLMIEVINTGRKLTPEDLARISRLLGEEESAKGHVGIRNVNQRLHLIFGETAGLRFTVNARGETVATVCQPLQRAPEGPEGGREQ